MGWAKLPRSSTCLILQAHSDTFEIAAICGISQELLSTLGERYNVPAEHRDTDYTDLADQKDLDAVLVLNSDEYHTDLLFVALGCGKHVLIEKPMRLTRQEAKDTPPEAGRDRAQRASRLVKAAIGDAPPELVLAYRLLCSLSAHDLSAMRELLGMPRLVVAARHWGTFLTALFDYESFTVSFETGIDHNRRFDAHIAVYGETKEILFQYYTPYIRHLPTQLSPHRDSRRGIERAK